MKRVLFSILVLLLVLSACQSPAEYRSSIEYPEIPWNSTPEFVLNELGLKDAQTVTKKSELGKGKIAVYEDENLYTLYAADFDAFGENVAYAEFRFDNTGSSGQLENGLANIVLQFNDSADVNTIISRVEDRYGKGVKEYITTAQGMEPETVTATEYETFWVSEANLGNVLSEEDQDALLKYIRAERNSEFSDETFSRALSNHATVVTMDTKAGREDGSIVLYLNATEFTYFIQLLELAKTK